VKTYYDNKRKGQRQYFLVFTSLISTQQSMLYKQHRITIHGQIAKSFILIHFSITIYRTNHFKYMRPSIHN